MKSRVGIAILNWNGINDTLECVNSILKNEFMNYELFIVDNGSSDDSLEKLLGIKSKKVHIVSHEKNLGFDMANNLVVKKILTMGCEYVMILNNDVIVDGKFLRNLVNFLNSHPGISVVSPFIYDYYNRSELNLSNIPGRLNLRIGGGEPWSKDIKSINKIKKPFMVDYSSGCCWLIRRNVIEKCGLFNEKFFAYAEELDLALRMKKSGHKFYIIPSAKIWHKGSATSKKISWFRLYYSIRNMVWLERIHATNKEFFVFILNFLFIKIPKNSLKIMAQKNRIINSRKFVKAIYDGFFTKKSEFDSPEFYMICK